MALALVKRALKRLLPGEAVRGYHRLLRHVEARRNARLSPQQVFSEIYRSGKWGAEAGRPFHSGAGSASEAIVGPYVTRIAQYLDTLPVEDRRVVDLGCGDFTVGRRLVPHCTSYTGVDVVPELVARLAEANSDVHVQFTCLDIVAAPLPAGKVCLIRQVFQHLSNQQISQILKKLSCYEAVFITEHYPAEGVGLVPNLDKVHGAGIRLFDNSAVVLDQPPFSCDAASLELFLSVPAHSFSGLSEGGTIKTFKWAPQRGAT